MAQNNRCVSRQTALQGDHRWRGVAGYAQTPVDMRLTVLLVLAAMLGACRGSVKPGHVPVDHGEAGLRVRAPMERRLVARWPPFVVLLLVASLIFPCCSRACPVLSVLHPDAFAHHAHKAAMSGERRFTHTSHVGDRFGGTSSMVYDVVYRHGVVWLRDLPMASAEGGPRQETTANVTRCTNTTVEVYVTDSVTSPYVTVSVRMSLHIHPTCKCTPRALLLSGHSRSMFADAHCALSATG